MNSNHSTILSSTESKVSYCSELLTPPTEHLSGTYSYLNTEMANSLEMPYRPLRLTISLHIDGVHHSGAQSYSSHAVMFETVVISKLSVWPQADAASVPVNRDVADNSATTIPLILFLICIVINLSFVKFLIIAFKGQSNLSHLPFLVFCNSQYAVCAFFVRCGVVQEHDNVSQCCYRQGSLSLTSAVSFVIPQFRLYLHLSVLGTRVRIIGFHPHLLVVEPSTILSLVFLWLGC